VTTYGPWQFRHRQSVTMPLLENFLITLRSDHGIAKIQVVGYCFGGPYALLVGGNDPRLVDAVVSCHPSQTKKSQYEQVQVPTAIVCAEEDSQLLDAFRLEVEQILAGKTNIPSKFLLTQGTVHGFA
jgi:dienelactone hydrolase